ncbi:MAG: FAD-dependent oxidoreductase [Coriobacteriia bacterium]
MAAQKTGGSLDWSPMPPTVFAPCRSKCPAHVDVPGYITAIAEGRFTDALEIVLERNPLPSVCGRICLRPCEEGCRRCLLDEPVAIAMLKRAAADFGAYQHPKPRALRKESVAVVGSGPAGLTVAHDLAAQGLRVTIIEAKPKLGGMLRYGIPEYRLPGKALDRDISHILSLGVEVRTGVKVGADVTLARLGEEHDAVVVTAGLQSSRVLEIPGAHLPRVLAALPFLEAAACGERTGIGKRVVVVGGGNVAMDVARTARRLGAAQVDVVCLESAEEMPASRQEVEEARLEGVGVHCSWGPREILGEEDVSALDVVRCTSVFDEDRRFSPVFDESETRRFEADTVIFATGQGADIGDLGIETTPRGGAVIDPQTMKTSIEGVYAAGDVVTGPTKVIDAIAEGHRVAACVIRDLTGDTALLDGLDQESDTLGEVPESMRYKVVTRRRVQMERLEFYEAVGTFDEIEAGYTEYEAAREAQRCLGCTTGARLVREKCASCLTCVRVCPHNAPNVKYRGYLIFDAEACHACGACASQCPAHAINIEGHSEEEMDRRVETVLAGSAGDATMQFACGCTPLLPELGLSDPRTLTVTCLLRVSEATVLRALQHGAGRVVFTGCVEVNCRYPYARELVARREADIRALLRQMGMDDALIVPEATDEDEGVHLR